MEHVARQCAHLCKYSYYGLEGARHGIESALDVEITDIAIVENSNAEALMVVMDDAIFVAWRGTETEKLADVLTDMDIRKVDAPEMEGKVHAGFYTYYCAAISGVKDQLRSWSEEYGPMPLVITGHSLGAAAATLMYKAWPGKASCFVFGSPRVGDRRFARNYDKPLDRFSVMGDPVTSVPTVLRWCHVSTVHLMTPFGTLWQLPARWRFWVTTKNLISAFFQGDLLNAIRAGAKDHSIDEYIKRLHDIRSGDGRIQQKFG